MSPTTVRVATTVWSVSIDVTTTLEVSAEVAWRDLLDTHAYPDWNPFVTRLDGTLAPGQRLDVDLALGGRRVHMRPRVTEVLQGRSFAWLGHLVLPGLFDGAHRFEIRPLDDARSELVQSETLSGALVHFARRLLTGDTPRGFVAMNDAFKTRVERAR